MAGGAWIKKPELTGLLKFNAFEVRSAAYVIY
jgi:hypothetical protein